MTDRTDAAFVISWAQTVIEGNASPSPGELRVGASWRWAGQAMRVDGPSGAALLGQALGSAELHERAARTARRMCATVVPMGAPGRIDLSGEHLLDRGFVVTDGRTAYEVSRIEPGDGQPALVLFVGKPPPQDRDLWIARIVTNRRAEARARLAPPPPVTGLVAGSRVATPQGPRPVERLVPGDRVLTRGGNACVVRFAGKLRLTSADLRHVPAHRPIRFSQAALGPRWTGRDLHLAPDQTLELGGPAGRALFGRSAVLVRAGDLLDHPGVCVDPVMQEVTYVQLLLERHGVVVADGMGCESFHPDAAVMPRKGLVDPDLLKHLDPKVLAQPSRYGPVAGRRLSRGEAALLLAGGTLRAVA